ncbi:MAG: DUF885 domain-containing protein [Ignavibacteriae bacterium]|nr:DUF885 domain-containing protein [Ignavibacteriota bacterium]MCB9242926.1 DUF885 domain-containing protein [Ignavibacteriales bacterium]
MNNSENFKSFSEKFLKSYFDLHPGTAVYLGLHEYDGIIPDFSEEGLNKSVELFSQFLDELNNFDYNELSQSEKIDYDIIKWTLEQYDFDILELKAHKNNPMAYTFVFGILNMIMGKEYAPYETRVRSVFKIMTQIPRVFEQAKANLNEVVPSIFCDYAKRFCTGYINFFEHDLRKTIEENGNEELLTDYKRHIDVTTAAFRDYIEFIENKLVPKADNSFPIGAEKFEKMLRLSELIDMPLPEIKEMGLDELESLKKRMNDLIVHHDLLGKLDSIEDEHPTEENLISETEDTLLELTEFIKEKDIIDVPEKLNCKVIEMPEFMNIGFAAMGTAGPFEDTDESFYYVALPGKEWAQDKKDEWLSLFNYPTLKLISIHEAFPGHYIHLMTSYEKASKISNVFMSYSFIEGWAHYTEEMMIDEGFDLDDPKVRYAQLKEALIRCCRYLVAIGLHTEGMTIDEATEFFMKNAHMNETTARSEAERGTYDPGYINYTLGKILMKRLRDNFFKKYNGEYTLKDFHNRVTSIGAPPFKIAEKIILNGN